MGSPTKVVFIGQGRWSRILAASLSRLDDPRLTASSVDLDRPVRALSWRVLRVLRRADVLVRVGFRPGAATRFGRAFEAYWAIVRLLNGRAMVVVYWVGTDVANAVEQAVSGGPTGAMRRIAGSAVSYAVTPDLAEELAGIGIEARVYTNPWTLAPIPEVPTAMPAEFSVLTYVPDFRFDFYGGPAVLRAARGLPGIRFRVMGGTGGWAGDPPRNLEFLGWVEDTERLFRDSSVVVRLVRHDGQGGTAIEGLLHGRWVVYSRRLEHCEQVDVDDADGLVAVVSRFADAHGRGELPANFAGAAWARERFDPKACARRLADALLAEVDGP